MKVLFLAPHPFYQDRGTPIAVNMLLKVLSDRKEVVDLVTYHEGTDLPYNRVSQFRIPSIPFVKNIRPGLSWKKLVCDVCLFVVALRLARTRRYTIVHAVEESVFVALCLKFLFKIEYVYDMDSSLPEQIIEKFPIFSPFLGLLRFFEGVAIKNAKAVLPVCEELVNVVKPYNPNKVLILHDMSLLNECNPPIAENIRANLGITGLIFMYVGNLERYQGIDLLLDSFFSALSEVPTIHLVIVGGEKSDIKKYKEKCEHMGMVQNVHFLGPRPLAHLSYYLSQSDILVSPRIKGKNTPMKLYSYLQSGKPILATKHPTHTQILQNRVAMLAEPEERLFAKGMVQLITNENLRSGIGQSGKQFAEENFTLSIFQQRVNDLYDWLRDSLFHGSPSQNQKH